MRHGVVYSVIVQALYYRQLSLCYTFSGSTSSVDETRLRRHLFHDPDNDILTTPIYDSSDYVEVSVGIEIQKLIDMVKQK